MVQTPVASPVKAPDAYPFPKTAVGLLPWSDVVDRLEQARNYWLSTTRPDGRPHATPLWGAWMDGMFYFQGAPEARWARNIARNPAASIHLESGNDVVIIEGVVEYLTTDEELGARLVAAWNVKYDDVVIPEPVTEGIYCLRPANARGWSPTPENGTRWTFPGFDGSHHL